MTLFSCLRARAWTEPGRAPHRRVTALFGGITEVVRNNDHSITCKLDAGNAARILNDARHRDLSGAPGARVIFDRRTAAEIAAAITRCERHLRTHPDAVVSQPPGTGDRIRVLVPPSQWSSGTRGVRSAAIAARPSRPPPSMGLTPNLTRFDWPPHLDPRNLKRDAVEVRQLRTFHSGISPVYSHSLPPSIPPNMTAAIRSAWALFLGIALIMLGNGLQGSLLTLRAGLEGFTTPRWVS